MRWLIYAVILIGLPAIGFFAGSFAVQRSRDDGLLRPEQKELYHSRSFINQMVGLATSFPDEEFAKTFLTVYRQFQKRVGR